MTWDSTKTNAVDPNNPTANEQIPASEWNDMVTDQKTRTTDAEVSSNSDVSANTSARHTQDTDTKIIVGDTEVSIADTGFGLITFKVDNTVTAYMNPGEFIPISNGNGSLGVTGNRWGNLFADDITITNNIVVGGTVDGHDIDSEVTANNAKISYDSTSSTKVGHLTVTQAVDLDTMESDVSTNNSKDTNVSTNLSLGTVTSTTMDVNSSDGTNATLIAADTDDAGLLTAAKFDEIVVNNGKTTNATHSGEVTGATVLTIADNIVDEANMKISNAPTNDYVLTADSGATGGWKWAAAGGSGDVATDAIWDAAGDLAIGTGADTAVKLTIGSNGYVLTSNGTTATWAANSAGFADPMTTRGDVIIRNASNNTARLAIGTNTQVLTSDGTDITWEDASGGGGTGVVNIERTYTGNLSTGRLLPITITDQLDGLDLKEVRLSALALPTGADLLVDVRLNGTATTDSIFTSDVEIEIATGESATNGVYQSGCDVSGSTVGTAGTTIDAARDTVAENDILWIYITQVGSTIAGADLVVTLTFA